MTIDEMKAIKKEKGYTYAMMSKLSGVPVGTVQKIFSGATSAPRYDTLAALERIFREDNQETKYSKYMEGNESAYMLGESANAYNAGKQGEYTIDDYRKLPDERRAELIDGYIYDMSSPSTIHQMICGEVYWQISNYIKNKGGGCMPFVSPVDVQLDCDEKTVVQPDVLILCDEEKLRSFGIFGAPDFVLEVVSSSSKKRDYGKKLAKYMDAGVREYWIVNPYQKTIIVYDFSSEVYPVIYSMDTDVPVAVYGGNLKLNLSGLLSMVDKLME